MALPYIPCFSFLFPFVAFYFAHGKHDSLSNCPKGFPCGNLGPLEFPFAHHTNPHCGLISVDCDAKPFAKLQLETGGDWYQIASISWDDSTITLEDSKLQTLFRSRNCSISNYSVKFPNSPSITFDNLEGNKLQHKYIKCKRSQGDHICDYESINCVDGFSLYHKRQLVSENRKCDSANCTLYPTPIVVERTTDPLTTQFGLYFEVSPACCHCYNGGGQCTSDSKNEFQCAKGKSKLRLILSTVLGGLALILVSLALFVVWRRKKGSKGYSRNTSLGPISDPERGQSRFFGILVFSYSELEEATNNFDPSKELGDGGFSTVYYGGASKSNALDMGWSFTCRWCDFDACCSYQEQLLKSPELAIVFLLYGICNRKEKAAMARPSVPCLFFLIPLMALYFAHGEDELPSNCSKGFSCGPNIGYLEFPFAKHTQADCGLVAVNCDTTPPKIQLAKGEDWYHLHKVIKFWDGYTIIVEEPKLRRLFERRNCKILNYSIQFRSSPSITLRNFEPYDFSTFLKCNHSEVDDDFCNYERYNHCTEDYSLYYKRPLIKEDPACIPDSCTPFPTPIFIYQTNDILTVGLGVELQVTEACHHCYHRGGQCRADSNNEFQCKKGKSKQKLILITVLSGVSGGLALVLVSLAIFLVWQHKKGRKGYSRNTSLDPASDLERGRSKLFGILVFSYSELEEATNNFDPSKELGDGGFGTVYYGAKEIGPSPATVMQNSLRFFHCLRGGAEKKKAGMGVPFNPCFFLLLFPLIMLLLYFAHGEDEFLPSNCMKQFPCGSVGPLVFPFAPHTHPHCGLVAVDCDAKPLPNIQLETGGDWYELVKPPVWRKWGEYVIFLGDVKLQSLFDAHNYSNLNYTLQFPCSPSITFHNLEAKELKPPFWICNYSKADDMGNYKRYNCTEGFILTYKAPRDVENPKCDTANCTLYPTPIFFQQTGDWLPPQFGLELQVTEECSDCYFGGGQCTADSNNKFQCKKDYCLDCKKFGHMKTECHKHLHAQTSQPNHQSSEQTLSMNIPRQPPPFIEPPQKIWKKKDPQISVIVPTNEVTDPPQTSQLVQTDPEATQTNPEEPPLNNQLDPTFPNLEPSLPDHNTIGSVLIDDHCKELRFRQKEIKHSQDKQPSNLVLPSEGMSCLTYDEAIPLPTHEALPDLLEIPTVTPVQNNEPVDTEASPPPEPRRSTRVRTKPAYLDDYTCQSTIKRTSPHDISKFMSYESLSQAYKGFFCGSMGYLEFPFAQHTQPHCGLVVVNCSAIPPTLLLETGGDSYQLQLVKPSPVWGEYVIFLGDVKLQRLLEYPNYSNLNYTLQFPNSPSITFHNLEPKEFNDFSKCNYSQPTDDIGNYESYNCTNGFSLKYKSELVPENNPICGTAAANCTLYPTPILFQQKNALLTAQFGLYLQLSPPCYDCYHCGGFQFTAGNNNKSQCTKDCDAKQLPNIQLETGGDWYQLQLVKPSPVWGHYMIFLGDIKLQRLLEYPNYSNLNYTLQFPYSPSITFHNLEAEELNPTFLKCNYSEADDMGNYERYNCTQEFSFTLNYKHPLSPQNPKFEAPNYTLYPTPILVKQTNSV
nr:LEAF RUST 10 DISEASE-RESISTANCE LOCUS RECEPTOR-LIKE PROTEIN KINASE-like 1.1 isoform X4 [Ipomoea trifida]